MFDRRELLKAFGLGAAGAGLVGCADPLPPADPRVPMPAGWAGLGAPSAAAFPQGVQCGDPHPDSVILWTRTPSASCELVVARWTDGAWAEAEPLGCTVEDGGFVHIEVDFEPDQPFAYQFRDGDGALSPVGYGRSAPAPDAAVSLVIGATSCASQGHGDYPSMPAALSRGPMDLWCWLGDTIYNDGVYNTSGYRGNWQNQLGKDGFQAVLGTTPGVFTWDDHEVDNDWGDTVNGPEVDPGRLEIAYQAFFDHTPTRRFDDPRRIYRSFRLGRTAEVFVMDCRGERDEEGGVYISEAQMQWLLEALSASTATWKLLLNSVPISDLPGPYDIDQVIRDRWDGYPTQRAQLLDHIASNEITGVLFVSGDVHHGTFCRVDAAGGAGANLLEIFTGPAGSSLNPLGNLLENEPDQFLWSAAVWNCVRMELHPAGFCHIEVVGEEGQTWLDTLFDDRGEIWYLEGEHPE